MFANERHHGFDRRLSSAMAKYTDALRRISLAARNSQVSRSSSFSGPAGKSSPLALVVLGLIASLARRLALHPHLRGDRAYRCSLHALFVLVLEDYPDRPFMHLIRIPRSGCFLTFLSLSMLQISFCSQDSKSPTFPGRLSRDVMANRSDRDRVKPENVRAPTSAPK
ncbi:hypothetical protein [Burkholderia diffusa]|uniref:hypothetical protein n=1 Tax=Burkholderia diffusa TaxID=488732 RepID=UPI0012D998E1|nr:hypothetical protein [Burkholderia diffusa]